LRHSVSKSNTSEKNTKRRSSEKLEATKSFDGNSEGEIGRMLRRCGALLREYRRRVEGLGRENRRVAAEN
jgi:hypothetical protein